MDLTALREAHVTFGHLTCRAWEAKRASNAANRQKNQSGCKCHFSTIHLRKGVWKPQSPKAHYLDSTSKRLWPKAQGCDEGATLGKASENIFNLEEVVAAGARSHNLFEVG